MLSAIGARFGGRTMTPARKYAAIRARVTALRSALRQIDWTQDVPLDLQRLRQLHLADADEVRQGASGFYDSVAKQKYRAWVWRHLAGHNSTNIVMPSAQGSEIETALAAGCRFEHLICLDNDPAVTATLRARYPSVPAVCADLEEYLWLLSDDNAYYGPSYYEEYRIRKKPEWPAIESATFGDMCRYFSHTNGVLPSQDLLDTMRRSFGIGNVYVPDHTAEPIGGNLDLCGPMSSKTLRLLTQPIFDRGRWAITFMCGRHTIGSVFSPAFTGNKHIALLNALGFVVRAKYRYRNNKATMESLIIEADWRNFSRPMPKALRDARDRYRIAKGEERKYPAGTREVASRRVVPPHAEDIALRIAQAYPDLRRLDTTAPRGTYTCETLGHRGLRP